ncbi:MAG: hypothetical protein ACRDL4_17215 [Thermoleophilaceae bacterium]
MADGAQRSDRYEPLPGVAHLPAWLWRRLPLAARVALGLLPVAAVALAFLLGPGIDEAKDERAREDAARLASLRTERIERIRAEQRPRFRRGAPAGTDRARRTALVAALPPVITEDARARVAAGTLDGPIRSVECEPYPRTASGEGAHLDPGRRTGRYACLAVTSEVRPTELNEAAAIGHPYRVRVDFDTGRYAFCKISGRPGEGAISRRAGFPPVPAACGGD